MLADLKHAIRAIARMPLVAAVVVASLAIGIGVNTVVFSWIQAVVFKPLPGVPDATSYYSVEPRTDAGAYAGVAWPEYNDLRERLTTFDRLIAFRMTPAYVGETGRAERAYALLVSGNYFDALGLRPALGRFLAPGEAAHPGGAPVVVVSHDYWQNKLGARNIAGQVLRVNGRDVAVIGVAPRGFQGTTLGLSFDLWFPATLAPEILPGSRELTDRGSRGYSVLGRLRPGVSRAQAQADVDVMMRQLSQAYPDTNATLRGEVLAFSEAPRGPQRFLPMALGFLQAAMLLLLLTVCGNTANLVLARASVRQREIGVRLALGARPSRVVRLLITENVVLGLAGAALGVAVAMWGTDALRTIPPLRGMPIRFQTSVDWVGLAFTILLGTACGVIFGAAPAMQLAWMDPQAALRQGNRTASRSRLRDVLMGVQVALALVILVVAALFIRGLASTRDIDPGFKREGVLLAAYDLTGRRVTPDSARDFASRVVEGARAISGVEAAAISSSVPLDIHGLPYRAFAVEGHARDDADDDQAVFNIVTPGYFALMGIRFVAGTDFADLKNAAAPRQVVVNEEFARHYLPGLEPLGRRVESRGKSYTIVGVVKTSLSNAFGEPPTAAVYYSYRDLPAVSGEVHVRTRPGGEALVTADLRRVVAGVDPELPLFNVRTLSEHIETNLVFRRIPAKLFAVLGPLMLVLAAFGIYAVVAYNVSIKTREIGVRMALGASGGRIIGALVGDSLRIVAVGAMLGWLAILIVVIDVVSGGPVDVPVFAGVPAILLAVAAAACWIPARRAARIDPLTALRHE
ncbi:MAG TPA: ABC transporter permease [Vicinamibacterales bacterium]